MASLPSDRDAIEIWLEAFDEHVRYRLLRQRSSSRGQVIGPLQITADLLLAPAARISALFDYLRRTVRSTPGGTELTWLLETGRPGSGPGLEELRALFAPWVCVTDVAMSQTPGRAVVSTRARRYSVSFAIDLTLASVEADWLRVVLQALKNPSDHDDQAIVGGFAVVDYKTLRALPRSQRHVIFQAMQEGWLEPVVKLDTLLSRGGRLKRYMRRLQKYFPDDCDILQCVTWAGDDPLNNPTAIVDKMHDAEVRYAFELERRPVVGNVFTRLEGPYLKYGSYYPTRFDRRMPQMTSNSDGPVALVGSSMPYGLTTFEDWALFWETRTSTSPERYISRADYKRREKLMASFAQAPSHGQFFHDFFFHNWRASEPETATTLINLGFPRDPRIAVDTVNRAAGFFLDRNDHRALATPEAFLDSARREANERSLESVADGLRLQRDEHHYLGTVEEQSSGELSPIERDFLEFLPDHCGAVLEIGGGYGRMGSALSARADTYINLELSRATHTDSANRFDVVGDFHKLPFREQTFDVIIANNVLEHAYQPLLALQELKRILVIGGKLFAVIPLDALNSEYDIVTHFWKADELSIMRALQAARLLTVRMEIVDINTLGMIESYPTCNALSAKLEAEKIDWAA